MNESKPMKPSPQLVLGITVLLLGVLFLLNNFGILHARSFLSYWPVLLVVAGFLKLFENDKASVRLWGGLLVAVGILLLFNNLRLIEFNIWRLWPVVLIVIGASAIWRVLKRKELPADVSSDLKGTAILGGYIHKSVSPDFRSANFFAFMGGCEVDLRGSSIQQGTAVIDCFVCMGGIEIRVPENWTVSMDAAPILGGVENKTLGGRSDENPKLILRGMVILGGLEIRN
jgi:predicted membrane protein